MGVLTDLALDSGALTRRLKAWLAPSGPGSPEGVVAAPVGSSYMQTDSVVDKSGVLRWLKVSGTSTTGWEPDANFDTGVIDVSSRASMSWVGTIYLRRKGTEVTVTFDNLDKAAATNPQILVLPSGFTADLTSHYSGFAMSKASASSVRTLLASTMSVEVTQSDIPAGQLARGFITFHTKAQPPSSLPGPRV